MLKICLSFVVVFCLNSFQAQENYIFQLTCRDKFTKEVIQNAEVGLQFADSSLKMRSDMQGKVFFTVPISAEFKSIIEHGYYNSESFNWKFPKANPGDTIKKTVELTKSKVKVLDEFEVLAPGVVKIVFQSDRLSVADFEILPTGELLLLAYPKRLAKGSELLIYDGKKIVQNFKLKENPIELIHDFRGNPHVVCEKGVYGIHRDQYGLGISNLEKSYFMRYVFPIVDTIQSKTYFSNFNPNYPAFDYMSFDQLDSTYLKIIEVKDELMMELYRAEYKWVDVRTKLWAANKEIETGIDKEIWVGANYFTSTIYYKELYAPMFQRHDSIYVFDYYKDLLFTFDANGKKVDSVAIFHHYQPKHTGWKKKLLQDDVTGEIYAFFEKAGICSIQKINLKTGALGKKVQFDHKYIDKLAISGNRAYYVYRPFESAQKKFLYMTQLPALD